MLQQQLLLCTLVVFLLAKICCALHDDRDVGHRALFRRDVRDPPTAHQPGYGNATATATSHVRNGTAQHQFREVGREDVHDEKLGDDEEAADVQGLSAQSRQMILSLIQMRIDTCGYSVQQHENSWTYTHMRSFMNWGNVLSVYWEARALVALGGKSFEGLPGFGPETWLHYLPNQVPVMPDFVNAAAFAEACYECSSQMGQLYPHTCYGAWTHFRGVIQNETNSALVEYEKHMLAKGHTGDSSDEHFEAAFHPVASGDAGDTQHSGKDVLIFLRFEFTTYAWQAKSFYLSHLPPDARRVTIMHQPYTNETVRGGLRQLGGDIHETFAPEMQRNISVLLQGIVSLVKGKCNCPVETTTGHQFHDFTRLVRHNGPVIAAGSTFGLAGILANKLGPVYFPRSFMCYTRSANAAKRCAASELPRSIREEGLGFVWDDSPFLSGPQIANFKGMQAADMVKWISEH
eukprot:TRINITY_DN1831_c0_g5_i1.p1 TRINITY_DN1831_c0_g5~~TRINITY_DN1831_c0_g5_i1.p1  ORF type:complete len:461 (-),score=50.03 TRINITY_DN1831_c0_g5_i1:8-1390(-)